MTTIFETTLHLLDSRAPQEVQAQLERATAAAFVLAAPGEPAAELECAADFRMGTVRYRLALRFVDALPQGHYYRLHAQAVSDAAADELVALRPHAERWIGFWTDGLTVAAEPPVGPGSATRRQILAEAWQASEAALADVGKVQQSILQAMRDGATFSTAHKEGGAVIRFDGRRYEHGEYGDHDRLRHFSGDAEFLSFLRRFFDYETSSHVWPARVPEAHAWRLILRRLEPPRGGAVMAHATRVVTRAGLGVCTLVVAVLVVAAGLAYWKYSSKVKALRAGAGPSAEKALTPLPAMPPEKDWLRAQDDFRRAVEAAKEQASAAAK
ncbi:MAG: hypothetical protein JNL90_10785 [Planctomycetes bacterium]|nr:hypothetical protein [Planctomycetota bacterium]